MFKLSTRSQLLSLKCIQTRTFLFISKNKKVAESQDLSATNTESKTKSGLNRGKYRVGISQANLFPGETLVGPPSSQSNLRPIKLFVSYDETKAERCLRLLRDEAHNFNEDFWSRNNIQFSEGLSKIEEKAASEGRVVSEQELSDYYKEYLDGSYKKYAEYNKGWWKRNLSMLVPGWISAIDSFRLKKKRNDFYMARVANSEFFGFQETVDKNAEKKNIEKNDSDNLDRRKEKVKSYY
ncbi:hypothetical protein BB559_003582 [Furculomyces boomerangus]|uniref:Apoptogenic protein 1, mitochondrial n=2 Tax=Harpellales TaxID=61421 RepID=A0A2T9YKG5_9FUNG|nr:hypothetical protein BB559_003582 [Furculomyces boomerangus]PWA00975.1 hypothetical protein BB558_002954 [Smittium angustum]